jgi:hypothetical protein
VAFGDFHGTGVNRTAVATQVNYFTAIADVQYFGASPRDVTKNTCDSVVDFEPYYKRLYSTANVASVARFGTSADTTPVTILNNVRAIESRSYYGYPYRGTAQDQLTTTAGYGDQISIPFAAVSRDADGRLAIKNYAFATNSNMVRYCYITCSDVGRDFAVGPATKRLPTVIRFNMGTATLDLRQSVGMAANATDDYEMYTVATAYKFNAVAGTWVPVVAADFAAGGVNSIAAHIPVTLTHGGNAIDRCLVQFDTFDFVQNLALDNFGFRDAIQQPTGLVFRSRKRVSQPMCAPVLNPNVRINSGPPLNFDSRHLPPEMRDFDLILQDIDFSFLPQPAVGDWQLADLRTFEFAGGNQIQTATDSLLYLPEFKLYTITATDKTFDQIIYTSNGMPSYIVLYSRYPNKHGQNYAVTQPRIETLNIACDTTKRKSNVVTDNMGKHYLFHLTMRNVHPSSGYNSTAYNKRQVVLLAAEDIGLMELKTSDYQSLRRVRFQFTGTCNQSATISVVFVYNNRGLEIQGADIKVVRV